MTRRVLAVLAAAGLAYLVLAAAMFLLQRRLLFVPDQERPAVAAVGVPGLQEITLRTADGLDLLAWFLPPPTAGAPVLAYFHGNGGTLANRAARVRMFGQLGWGLLMPEYRGYGGNPGAPSEAGFAMDARAAMDFLAGQDVPQRRIVVYGESIGTGVAVQVAAGRALGGVVLESPYTSIADIARRRFWFLPVDLLLRDPFCSRARIGQLQAPLLVVQGAQDTIVPPALGQALFAAAPAPKQLWTAPEAGHADLMQHGAEPVIAAFVAGAVAAGPGP